MFIVIRGTVVKCRRSQLTANHPTVVSSKPMRKVSNFKNRGKKWDIKNLLNDIQNLI